MKLTENFSLDELTVTNSGMKNVPSNVEIDNLKLLCENVLQPLRDLYGKPIAVNSGFRSVQVNKAVRGAKTSQHVKGQAADITAGSKTENTILFKLIIDNFDFDQLICEYDFSWVHVSYKASGNRKEVGKIANGGKYTKIN